jgi:predicted dinucleotide-binding enzyme
MRVGILGTGMVGQAIAAKLAELGHEVMVGTRDPAATLARDEPHPVYGSPPFRVWQAQHPAVKLAGFADAAGHGEMVVNATAGGASLDALRLAGEANLDGKVLIDAANALDFSRGMPPSLLVANTDSLAERIQRAFPGVRVVKALNTMNATLMVNPGPARRRRPYGVRVWERPRGQGAGHWPAHRGVRLAGRDRPWRAQRRAGRRDAGGALGAAVGRAADAGLQLQGGPVTGG